MGENSQVILPGRLHRAQPHKDQAKPYKDQAKLDEIKALVIIWMSRRPRPWRQGHPHHLLPNTQLIWEFLKGNTHRSKIKARSGKWVA
jgi:hypothetical protein